VVPVRTYPSEAVHGVQRLGLALGLLAFIHLAVGLPRVLQPGVLR